MKFLLLSCLAAATLPSLASSFAEVEPNDSKSAANRFTLWNGASITGSLANETETDVFRLSTANPTTPPKGTIYKYTLAIKGLGSFMTLLGQPQVSSPQGGGTVGAGSADVQVSATTLVWYGPGMGEQVYVSVRVKSLTAQNYGLSLTCEVAPVIRETAELPAGDFEFTTWQQGHLTDTDTWLYSQDSSGVILPIGGAGNDDSGESKQSRFSVTLAPGTYVFAVSDTNLANHLLTLNYDRLRPILDYNGPTACSSSTTGLNVAFAVRSPKGTIQVPATKSSPYQVIWYSFTVKSASPEAIPGWWTHFRLLPH